MFKNKMQNILALSLAMALLAATPAAMATQINGAFSMDGGFKPVPVGPGLGIATGIDFFPYGPGGQFAVSPSPIMGDFAALMAVGNIGAIKDFTFNPLPAGGIANFFTVNTVTFDLTSISIALQIPSFLVLEGTGIFRVPGFDDTPGVWNFTGQTVVGTGTFSWSATSGAEGTPIPEPGTLTLLGLGFAGIGILVRKRRS